MQFWLNAFIDGKIVQLNGKVDSVLTVLPSVEVAQEHLIRDQTSVQAKERINVFDDAPYKNRPGPMACPQPMKDITNGLPVEA